MKTIDNFEHLYRVVEAKEEGVDPEHVQFADFDDTGDVAETVEGRDMGRLTFTQAAWHAKQCYRIKESFLLYGDPGIGKSEVLQSVVRDLAAESKRQYIEWNKCNVTAKKDIVENPSKYFVLIDQRTAKWDPTDLQGIPDITPGEWLTMKPHMWVWVMTLPGSAGVLFLDEVNQAAPQVLKALFQVILDREVDVNKIQDEWGIFAAGNLGRKFDNEVLPLALTSRFAVAQLIPDPASWVKWAKHVKIDDNIVAFVDSDPSNNFYVQPQAEQSDAYPCPRSFVRLDRAIKDTKIAYIRAKKAGTLDELPGIYFTLEQNAQARCGANWASRFVTFLKYQKQYNWDVLSKDPEEHFRKVDVNKFHSFMLTTRNTIYKYFSEKSEFKDDRKVQEKIAKDFCAILNACDKEWRQILMGYINGNRDRDSRFIVSQLGAIIAGEVSKHPEKEPFKTGWINLKDTVRLSKGDV